MASDLPNKSYARIPVSLALPKLIEVQLDSFVRLKKKDWAISSTNYPRSNHTTKE